MVIIIRIYIIIIIIRVPCLQPNLAQKAIIGWHGRKKEARRRDSERIKIQTTRIIIINTKIQHHNEI